MEEFKHLCKFCSKSFPCGRSLGGHMRSHMVNDISAQTDGTKITKKKLPSLNNNENGGDNKNHSAETAGYGLRENPKKTWRLEDHSSHEDTSVLDKFCRECGQVYRSWKALFGHMKCHSLDKVRVSNNSNNSLEEEQPQDSWTGANNNQKQQLVMDGQSDNETSAPNRRKRSKRRIIRYMAAAYSSFLSSPNNASSSASEIEQEQEEVAMCLMMLSRDVGQWGGGFNSAAESSDNNSVFLETKGVSSKLEAKNSLFNGSEILKDKKLESEDSTLERRKSEFSSTGFSRQGIIKSKSLIDQFGTEMSKNLTKENEFDQAEMLPNKFNNSSKRKFLNCFDPELRSDSLLKTNALDSVDCKKSDESSKFECTRCNKVFPSYQALGGHRASHKRMNGCFASRIDSSENSIETEISPNPTADSNAIKSIKIDIPIDHLPTDCDNKADEASFEAKKIKGHECAICLKVFPTGQALGGHKRSHLAAGTEAKTNQTTTTEEPIPAIRDFFDLNLPAPVAEDGNGLVGFNQWWTGSTHKHKALVGLTSN